MCTELRLMLGVFVVAVVVTGIMSWLRFKASVKKHRELGITEDDVVLDDNGMTAFERRIFWQLVCGTFDRNDPRIVGLDISARKWLLLSYGLGILFVLVLLATNFESCFM